MLEWKPFLKEEFKNAISKCNNFSVPSPDKISWKILKRVIDINDYLVSIVNITNACINLGHWPSHFKLSTLIIIPKPNKLPYNSSKLFCPIVLLNILGKLIEKIIGERLQFHTTTNNFVHSHQFCGLKQQSISNVGMFLIYIIQSS